MSFQIKGWCPGALRPMRSGDGLVLRIRARGGRLLPEQSRVIADLSARLGNGLIDLTSRANLQLRGLDQAGHAEAITALDALGLLDDSPAAEARRNVMLSPVAPVDGPAWHLAAELSRRLTAPDAPDLPGKFGFAIDEAAPVLSEAPADIRLIPKGTGWHLHPEGADWHLPAADPAQDALALAGWFIAQGGVSAGRGRMRALIAGGTRHSDAVPGGLPAPAPAPQPGPLAQGRLLGFAFGQITAAQLAAITAPIRLTPWRMLLLETPEKVRIPGAIEAPGDPLLRSHACTGAPACPQARAETRELARTLAPLAASLHVSGCAKGCAHRGRAAITLVATGPDRFDLIADGTTADPPLACALSRIDLASRLAQWRAHDAPI
ncbi:precorrin-3B synthase [Paracoccus limosus]|uniref:Precorrin-3B synthase n=1 Tax=Paracoccus limosus TaxID=913252 RepID=A0A844H5J8_9RHOB|nr:precorrin-3B synthase [Paracoccus limosus]MTH34491.1 precorrin-3B synthase [Paracoccus limosus]